MRSDKRGRYIPTDAELQADADRTVRALLEAEPADAERMLKELGVEVELTPEISTPRGDTKPELRLVPNPEEGGGA